MGVCVSLMPVYINTYMSGSARTKLTVITIRSYLLCSIYTVNYALRFAYATLLGCVAMQCITTFYVAWSVCLSVLQKQMNQLQCRLDMISGGPKERFFRWGHIPSP